MEELRHLQLVVLDIAKDLDALCRENGIEYYLGGGGAIGAIRHKGYIPWDDDLDFLMTYDNYEKFVKVCQDKLDSTKYLLEIDPTGKPSLKVRLLGTKVVEKGKVATENEESSIFLDVFRLEKAPEGLWAQRWQYFFSKVYVAYFLSLGGYIAPTRGKKIMITMAKMLRFKPLLKFVWHQVDRYNRDTDPKVFACFWGITRFKNTFTSRDIYGKPLYVPFEDTQLPVPEHYHEYLTQFFGNYMQLPPEEKRVAPHIVSIDFGKY